MMFLLRCLPKNYGAASFRALRMFDARPCMVPFSTSASLFEQTIDLPEAEYPLPVLQQSHAPPPKESMVQSMQQMMRNNLSISHQQEIILNAELLFQAADYQSNQARWFGPGRIGRDFRSRHAILSFHIWLLHRRLLVLNPDVDKELFHIFWDNTLCRIRSLKVYELSVNKHLASVQKYTLVHMLLYDHAYSPSMLLDPAQRMQHLRQVVYSQWLHPGTLADDVEFNYRQTADHIDRLVWYIDAQYRNLIEDCPAERICPSGQVRWMDLPEFANWHDPRVSDGFLETDEAVPLYPEDMLPFPWRANITNRGWTYYWNPETRIATWERPLMA